MSALPSLLDRHAFLDLETTGLDPAFDEVVELGIAFVEAGVITRRFTRLFRPSRPLAPVIQRLTGLTDALLSRESPFSDFRGELVELLRGWTVVAHNALFEQRFLAPELTAAGCPVLDSCEVLHYLYPELPSHALEAVIRWAGVGEGAAHRALKDSEDTFGVLSHALGRAVREARVDELTELSTSLAGDGAPEALLTLFGRALAAAREVRPELTLTPPEPFLPAATERTRAQPKLPPGEPGALVAEAQSLLGEGGLLEQALPDFIARAPQQAMGRAVATAFERGDVLAVEAGTGTGKSLGYLVPAIALARREGVRVGIAPHTRALQEQLVDKELRRLHEATSGAFGYAVLKGQQNYLCRRRGLEVSRPAPGLAYPERAARAYLRAFLRRSPVGDLERVSSWFKDHFPPLEELLVLARSEAATTLEKRCPHYSRCFFHSAVAQAEAADVVVVNQALALSWPERYPALTHLVLDEAHELEDAASNAWATELSGAALGALVGRLTGPRGLARALRRDGKESDATRLERAAAEVVLDEKALFEAWVAFAEQTSGPPDRQELRLSPSNRSLKGWLRARDALHALRTSLESLAAALDACAASDPALARELHGVAETARAHTQFVEELADRPSRERCDALTLKDGTWSLLCQPVEVGSRFVAQVVEKAQSVVLTSATLGVAPGKPWVLERLGLDRGARPATLLELPTPFDAVHHALVVLVTDAPDPTGPAFVDWAAARVSGLARFLGGRTLGLFASAKRQREVGDKVARELAPDGIEVLQATRQGLRALAARQEEDLGTVLLGTKGLWQGLDVPGPGVSCVFIDKLPLEPSGRPLVEAREELLGGEPWGFLRYRLPRALLQLRQGVGRLLRSPSDRGVVVIADPGADAYRAQVYEALEGYRVEALGWRQARLRLHQAFTAFGVEAAAPAPTPSAPAFTGQGSLFGGS